MVNRPTARIVRFCLWVAAVAMAFPGQWIVVRFHWNALIAWIGLAMTAVLLATTPVDAIKLPRWISELFILIGLLGLMFEAGSLRAIGVPAITLVVFLQIVLRWGRLSAWWIVLVAWNPWLISPH